MKSRRISLFPIFLTVFIDVLGLGLVVPVLAPLFLESHGLLPVWYSLPQRTLFLGFLIAVFPIIQFFGAPILGALSDRYGRRKILLLSIGGTLVGYLLFALGIHVRALWLLFISRVLDGFTGGNLSTVQSAIADVSDEKSKARNFGITGMAFGLGFILGPYIGGKISDPTVVSWFTYATPFLFAAGLCLVNLISVYISFPETLTKRLRSPISFMTGFRNIGRALALDNLRTMFIVIFLYTFGLNFFTQFFQVYLIHKFHFTRSLLGDAFAYVGIWLALVQGLIAPLLARWFKIHVILTYSLFFFAASFLIQLLPSQASTLLLTLPLISLFVGITQPLSTTMISDLSGRRSQGEVLGIQQSVIAMAQAIPPIIAGAVVALNFNLPLVLAAATTFGSWLVFVIFFRKEYRRRFQST